MHISFDNFLIRPVNHNDAAPLLDLIDRNRERLRDYFPLTTHQVIDLSTSEAYIARAQTLIAKREHFCMVVEDGKQLLKGLFIVKNIDWRVPKAELAYFIDKDHEGQGIMTSGLKALSRHCMQEMGMNKLFIITSTDNYSSRRIAEKTGFVAEGILRKNFRTSTGLVDNVYYGLLKEDI